MMGADMKYFRYLILLLLFIYMPFSYAALDTFVGVESIDTYVGIESIDSAIGVDIATAGATYDYFEETFEGAVSTGCCTGTADHAYTALVGTGLDADYTTWKYAGTYAGEVTSTTGVWTALDSTPSEIYLSSVVRIGAIAGTINSLNIRDASGNLLIKLQFMLDGSNFDVEFSDGTDDSGTLDKNFAVNDTVFVLLHYEASVGTSGWASTTQPTASWGTADWDYSSTSNSSANAARAGIACTDATTVLIYDDIRGHSSEPLYP